MKKLIIKITAATVFSCISFTAFAQQAADRKPKIAESPNTADQDKTTLTATEPQIVAGPKLLTVNEQPKPIVPGGEFKPMDTNMPVKNYTKYTPAEKVAPSPQELKKQQ